MTLVGTYGVAFLAYLCLIDGVVDSYEIDDPAADHTQHASDLDEAGDLDQAVTTDTRAHIYTQCVCKHPLLKCFATTLTYFHSQLKLVSIHQLFVTTACLPLLLQLLSFRAATRFQPNEPEVWSNLAVALESADADHTKEIASAEQLAEELEMKMTNTEDNRPDELQTYRNEYLDAANFNKLVTDSHEVWLVEFGSQMCGAFVCHYDYYY
jgi:hypothetical protein